MTEDIDTLDAEYAYTESGLDNVVVIGLPRPDTDTIRIPNVNKLHAAITEEVATKTSRLVGKELRYLRSELELTPEQLAKLLGNEAQLVKAWENGESTPSVAEEVLIRLMVLQRVEVEEFPPVDLVAEWTHAPAAPYKICIVAVEHDTDSWAYWPELAK